MESWAEIHAHVRETYVVHDEAPGCLILKFGISGRSQRVLVMGVDASPFVHIASLVAKLHEVDVLQALSLTQGDSAAGLVQISDSLAVMNSAPVAGLTAGALDMQIQYVTAHADRLEKQLTGRDVN